MMADHGADGLDQDSYYGSVLSEFLVEVSEGNAQCKVATWWDIPVIKNDENSSFKAMLSECNAASGEDPLLSLKEAVSGCQTELLNAVQSPENSATRTLQHVFWKEHLNWCKELGLDLERGDPFSLYSYFESYKWWKGSNCKYAIRWWYCSIYANLFVIKQMTSLVAFYMSSETSNAGCKDFESASSSAETGQDRVLNPLWEEKFLFYYILSVKDKDFGEPQFTQARVSDQGQTRMKQIYDLFSWTPEIKYSSNATTSDTKGFCLSAPLPPSNIDKALALMFLAQRLLLDISELLHEVGGKQSATAALNVLSRYDFLQRDKPSEWGTRAQTFDEITSDCYEEISHLNTLFQFLCSGGPGRVPSFAKDDGTVSQLFKTIWDHIHKGVNVGTHEDNQMDFLPTNAKAKNAQWNLAILGPTLFIKFGLKPDHSVEKLLFDESLPEKTKTLLRKRGLLMELLLALQTELTEKIKPYRLKHSGADVLKLTPAGPDKRIIEIEPEFVKNELRNLYNSLLKIQNEWRGFVDLYNGASYPANPADTNKDSNLKGRSNREIEANPTTHEENVTPTTHTGSDVRSEKEKEKKDKGPSMRSKVKNLFSSKKPGRC